MKTPKTDLSTHWEGVATAELLREMALIRAVLDSRAGRPAEAAVRGDLLILFGQHWPRGWCWEDEPLWGEGPRHGEPPPLDPLRFYDLDGYMLVDEEGQEASLWDLFKEWYDARPETEGTSCV